MPKAEKNLTRALPINSIRAAENGNERQFVLSFSSEEPHGRYFGAEILDHSEGCVDLTRLKEIGVMLFNHKRDAVIGKIVDVAVVDNRGTATVEFDTDAESQKIMDKVASGTLKGVSVGYAVDVWEEVTANKKSSDGRFTGPCFIAKKWTPYEISIVSVPADPTVGVGRELDTESEEPKSRSRSALAIAERQLQINKNYM